MKLLRIAFVFVIIWLQGCISVLHAVAALELRTIAEEHAQTKPIQSGRPNYLSPMKLSLLRLGPGRAPSLRGPFARRQDDVLPRRCLASLIMAAGLGNNDNFRAVARRQAIVAGVSALFFRDPLKSLALVVDPSTTLDTLQRQEKTIEDLFNRATPSVVSINVFTKGYQYGNGGFALNEVDMPQGTGSGFVWDSYGHIVTNYHVIQQATSAKVTVTRAPSAKPVTYDAELVGISPDKDIAVLQINGGKFDSSLTPVELSSEPAEVGATALAIGNPFGLDHTLTLGVVSGLGRDIPAPTGRPISNIIQTDASVNPGNSGGVLLDSSGNLIGMNTAILSQQLDWLFGRRSNGIGFAVPAETIKQQVEALLKDGSVKRALLGIVLVPRDLSAGLGIRRGVLVASVSGNAEKAGIRGLSRKAGYTELGDVIVKVQNTEVNSENDIFNVLDGRKAGDKVDVTVVRFADGDEKQISLSVQLVEEQAN